MRQKVLKVRGTDHDYFIIDRGPTTAPSKVAFYYAIIYQNPYTFLWHIKMWRQDFGTELGHTAHVLVWERHEIPNLADADQMFVQKLLVE